MRLALGGDAPEGVLEELAVLFFANGRPACERSSRTSTRRENKSLGAVLAAARAFQAKKDEALLQSKKVTRREKDRLRAARGPAAAPAVNERLSLVLKYMHRPTAAPMARPREGLSLTQELDRNRKAPWIDL